MKRQLTPDDKSTMVVRKKFKTDSDWTDEYGLGNYVFSPAESLCGASPRLSTPINDLGYNGRFSFLGPGDVILESLEGIKFTFSRSALIHARSVNFSIRDPSAEEIAASLPACLT